MYLFSIRNITNATSLVASSQVDTFEVDKLQDPLGSTRWRSTDLTPSIVIQFDVAQIVQAWGPWYTNAEVGDQVRLRLANTEANLTAAPLHDTGPVDVWPGTGADLSTWPFIHSRIRIDPIDQVSALWALVNFDYSGNVDGYVQVGALPMDTIFQPVRGHGVGWRYDPVQRAMFGNVLAGGSEERGGGDFKRLVAFTLISLTNDETFGELDEMIRPGLSTKPFGVVLLEDEPTYPMNHIFYGYMGTSDTSTRDRHMVRVQIDEP